MRRWWLPYLGTSFLLCSHVSSTFFGFLSSGTINLFGNSRGTLAPRAPREVGLFIFAPRVLIYRLSQGWYVSGPFSLLELGPQFPFHPRPHPTHNIYIYIYIWHFKIFPLYLLTCMVEKVLTIYKFLAYITKNKFHKLQKYKY